MLRKLLPREEGFFTLFQQTADILVSTAVEFQNLLLNPDNQHHHVERIAEYEKEADKIAYSTFQLLHKTFITPFDRNDIYSLTSHLDDVSDSIYRCAMRFPFYKLQSVPDELIQLGDCVLDSTKLLKQAIYFLNSLKRSAEILALCQAVDDIESKGSKILLHAEQNLFEKENDFKEFFKFNEIYSQTKDVLDGCEDTANTIKGIVLEYT